MSICDICGKEFEKKRSMTNHRRWHNLPEYIEFQDKCKKHISKAMKGNKSHLGIQHSIKTKKKMSEAKMGENNPLFEKYGKDHPNWKGEDVSYGALHEWIRKHKPIPKKCEKCGKVTTKLDASNISGEYKRDLNDWEYLCRSCHWKKDKIYLNFNNKKEMGNIIEEDSFKIKIRSSSPRRNY